MTGTGNIRLYKLFVTFFYIGIFTIGGGLAMIPLIQSKVVDEYGWLTKEEMTDCLAVAQGLPGVVAINVGTYIGYRKRRTAGALAATLGVVMPSFIIIIAVVLFLNGFENNLYVQGALTGIRAAAAGLIAVAAFKLGKDIIKDWFSAFIAVVCCIIAVSGRISVPVVILGSIGAGILYYNIRCMRGGDAE